MTLLTPMQAKVAECIRRGLNYQATADALGISYATAKNHATNAANRLASHNPHNLPPQAFLKIFRAA